MNFTYTAEVLQGLSISIKLGNILVIILVSSIFLDQFSLCICEFCLVSYLYYEKLHLIDLVLEKTNEFTKIQNEIVVPETVG